MTKKILVAYASLSGSTAEIAETTARAIRRRGAEADVADVTTLLRVHTYDAIILGASIRLAKPIRPARDFVKRFHYELSVRPTALFSVGMMPKDGTPESLSHAARYLSSFVATMTPVSMAMFAGKIDPDTLSRPWASLVARSEKDSLMGEGDWRDWEAIEAWSDQTARILIGPAPDPVKRTADPY